MFVEDFEPFFDTASGFAVQATVGAESFPVIFDNGYQAILNGAFESTAPTAMVASANIPSVVQGTSITVDSTSYVVTGVQPDGTGMTTLILELA